MAKAATTAFVSKPLLRRYFDTCEQTVVAGTNTQICRSCRAFALAEAAIQRENAYAEHRYRHETLYRRVFELLSNVPIDSHGALLRSRRTKALQLDDGMRRNVQDVGAYHGDRLGAAQTHLPLVQRDL